MSDGFEYEFKFPVYMLMVQGTQSPVCLQQEGDDHIVLFTDHDTYMTFLELAHQFFQKDDPGRQYDALEVSDPDKLDQWLAKSPDEDMWVAVDPTFKQRIVANLKIRIRELRKHLRET